MPPVVPDPGRIRSFKNGDAFYEWLAGHHDSEPELWIRMFKKGSGIPSIDWPGAIDAALCWGWIDGIRKSFDEVSFIQRFTPRRPKSTWSQINREHVARLSAAGRMTPHGQAQVDAAKADGRWDAAYAPIRTASATSIPEDLMAAIRANPAAQATFERLSKQNLFALGYRTNSMKTPAGRVRKIESLVEMLARGETIVPQGPNKR